jgi:hypothetical protein
MRRFERHAQFVSVFPSPTDNASQLSVNASQFDISSFLQRMGREATYGYAARDNSGGGGASQVPLNLSIGRGPKPTATVHARLRKALSWVTSAERSASSAVSGQRLLPV